MEQASSWLQAALLPETWEVCGVRCKSLTVWHSFVLGETGNPYLLGELTDRDAACSLLLYCSRDHDGGRALFLRPFHRRREAKRIARKLRRLSFGQIDGALMDYLRACLRVPQHKRPEPTAGGAGAASRSCAAPLPWAIVQFMAAGNPDKIESAWNTSYAVARCLFDAHRDIEGKVETLETADEERRFDEWNKGGEQ